MSNKKLSRFRINARPRYLSLRFSYVTDGMSFLHICGSLICQSKLFPNLTVYAIDTVKKNRYGSKKVLIFAERFHREQFELYFNTIIIYLTYVSVKYTQYAPSSVGYSVSIVKYVGARSV